MNGRQAALGGRLLRLRSAAGLEAGEVADAAGLDRAFYGRVETGAFAPDRLTYLDVLRLAEVLDVPPAAVLAD